MNRRELLKYSVMFGLGQQAIKTGVFAGDSSLPLAQNTGLIYDEFYLKHWLEPGHPESPERLEAIIQQITESALLGQHTRFDMLDDIEQQLELIHTKEHIAALKKSNSLSHDVVCRVVSDVLSATKAVCAGKLDNAFCATRPPGHHAENTGRVEGFCLYNSIAIAARYAQKQPGIEKVLIIDWDYHHGNGTESAFYDDPSVLFFSTHDWYAYPGTGDPSKRGSGNGEGYNINVHLPCGTDDEMIVSAFKTKLLPAVKRFKPDLILISAGFDSRIDDLLGCFEVSDDGFIQLTKMSMALANEYCDGRVVSILEGGYNIKGNASAVIAHVKTLMGMA